MGSKLEARIEVIAMGTSIGIRGGLPILSVAWSMTQNSLDGAFGL
jgi:hypothetical protein